jgi:hypothetical protein
MACSELNKCPRYLSVAVYRELRTGGDAHNCPVEIGQNPQDDVQQLRMSASPWIVRLLPRRLAFDPGAKAAASPSAGPPIWARMVSRPLATLGVLASEGLRVALANCEAIFRALDATNA